MSASGGGDDDSRHYHLPIYAAKQEFSTVFSTDNNEYHDLRAPLYSDRIPLMDLVQTTGPSDPACHSTSAKFNMSIFDSIIVEKSTATSTTQNTQTSAKRKIPKMIHMTSKSRCLTSKIKDNIIKWKEELPDHSIYFHDDAAVDRLLSKYFPGFPHLQNVKACSISGAAVADIWRYLVLWEYGGIYADIDSAPGPKFAGGSVIDDNDDAWFVVERIGVLGQYFMASSPHHPIMYLALMQCLARLVSLVDSIGTQYVPYITGPGVTKAAMMLFMKDKDNFQTVTAGTYKGLGGRTVTVAGDRAHSDEWIERDAVRGKQQEYTAMEMKHFSKTKNEKFKDSCYEHMYKKAIEAMEESSTGNHP